MKLKKLLKTKRFKKVFKVFFSIFYFLVVIEELEKFSIEIFNYLLFRCEAEEQSQFGSGAYELPIFGKFVYCGLQGIF